MSPSEEHLSELSFNMETWTHQILPSLLTWWWQCCWFASLCVTVHPSWPAGLLLCCSLSFQEAPPYLLQTARQSRPVLQQHVHPQGRRKQNMSRFFWEEHLQNNTKNVLIRRLFCRTCYLDSLNIYHFKHGVLSSTCSSPVEPDKQQALQEEIRNERRKTERKRLTPPPPGLWGTE